MNDRTKLPEGYNYQPFPKGISLLSSEIHGKGVFTRVKLKKNTIIGVTHIIVDEGEYKLGKNNLFRTPLGGFINHSPEPNCEIMLLFTNRNDYYCLRTIEDIDEREELTVDYYETVCGMGIVDCEKE